MSARLNFDQDYWRIFFETSDKDGNGIVSRAELMDSDLPKSLKMALEKRGENITWGEFLCEVKSYQERNLFTIILNKWVQFIVPPKRPSLKPGCYQQFPVEV